MKKIFFYSSLLALATSCTDEFDTLNVQNEKAQGISFKSEVVESRMMWEDNGTAYEPFWYAEMDRISIFALNAQQAAGNATIVPTEDDQLYWEAFDGSMSATYKATQSKKNGVFTSLVDDKTLHFDGDLTARFVATYPIGTTAAWNVEKGKVKISGTIMPSDDQTQKGLKGDNDNQFMYALASANRTNDYDAVGETVNLSFNRPMKALVFTTANANEYTVAPKDGKSIFGDLKTITVTTKGYDADDDGVLTGKNDIAPTALSYTAGHLLVDTLTNVATIVPEAVSPATQPTPINTITLNIGQEWNDEALAIAAIVPNDRKAYASVDEPWMIQFDFENITLTHEFDAIPKGTKFTNYMPVPALDIQDYEYLVTKVKSANDRVLIVNSGTFANIFNESGDAVKWNEGLKTEIAISEFAEIIVDKDVVIGDEEMAIINSFSDVNLKKLTLKGVTELKSKALSDLEALTYINMPEVTKIAEDAFASTHKLETVLLPAFDFSFSNAVTKSILKAANLETLDMSGVVSMKDQFPAEGFTLQNYTQLSKVIVKEGVEVGPSAFAGCTLLTEIENPIRLVGSSAFEGSGLKKIKLMPNVKANETDEEFTILSIPVGAFKDCVDLVDVLNAEGEELKPNVISNNAFFGAKKLVYLDLSATTSIGEYAFSGANSYAGAYKDEVKSLNILYVGATKVGKGAFQNTKLEYVEFTNLKDLTDNMLAGVNGSLKEVKFRDELNKSDALPFGAKAVDQDDPTWTGVKLFLNPVQGTDFYDGKKFYPKGDKNAASPKYYVFGTLTFE